MRQARGQARTCADASRAWVPHGSPGRRGSQEAGARMGVRARDLRHAAIGACAIGGDARMGVWAADV